MHAVLIAGIVGVLSDIDILINWLLNALGYSFKLLQHGCVMKK